jgi:processive 1,2-diacylglycerol beta-glucosyltransferase
MSAPPRILIVTAAFGEGHNSAARNLAVALEIAGAVARVADPCLLGVPRITDLVNRAYRQVTTHYPRLWGHIYHSTAHMDLSRKRSPILRRVETALAKLIAEYQPDAVVSTYPLYPYFMARINRETGRALPVFTVVTDSIEINAAWTRLTCDRWLLTDSATREALIRQGLPAEKLIDTGFPVHPVFAELQPVPADDPCEAFRILYFPTAQLSFLRRHARALLDTSPQIRLTIILGKNVRALFSRAREIKDAYPGRVRIVGWTRQVPRFLNSHHLVIGKAGGATVHEAIAARCPMLIHHLVPGQEEGNLRLLEIIGGGHLAPTTESLTRHVTDLLADHAAAWRGMKHALIRHGRNAGAIAAAGTVLRGVKGGSEISAE